MKKHLFIFAGLVFFIPLTYAQKETDDVQKLYSTAKVWGFLKYYHPLVNQGNFNWDEQLIAILPEVAKAPGKKALSKAYLDWISSLGQVQECSSCSESDSVNHFNRNFDLSWTQDPELFTPELSEKLKFIEKNRSRDSLYYACGYPYVGNVKIRNEAEYEDFEYPSEGYRLLSLFTFWNIVEYFYPYKYLIEGGWDKVLTDMIPRFRDAQNTREFHLALLELVMKIDDGHAFFVSKPINDYFGRKWIPVYCDRIGQKAVISGFFNDSLAAENDLRIGDVIEEVEGVKVNEIFAANRKYISGSNPYSSFRRASYALFNGASDSVKITIERNGVLAEKTIHRYPFQTFHFNNTDSLKWKWLENEIAYVNMGILEKQDVPSMMDTLMNARAIIFDIRNYPRGTLYAIAAYLNNEEKEFGKFTVPDFSYPGKFRWRGTKGCGQENGRHYRGKVVLLVNEATQSHAEFTCMCFQTADDVTVIGSQTAGADGNISSFELPGGYKTIITGLGVYYPDGRETQKVGIVPDIVVRPTIEGVRTGCDEVLEKAIKYLTQKEARQN